MIEKETFGEGLSKHFMIGDLVEWTSWDSDEEKWISYYGILLTMTNEIRSNRLVSISRVMPVNQPNTELDFFTMSLRLVSRGDNALKD